MTLTELLTEAGKVGGTGGTLWAIWWGGKRLRAEANKATSETTAAPADRSVAIMERTMTRLDAEVQRLSDANDRLQERTATLEDDGRRDRQSLREALSILTHPVAAILDWIDAGAQPPPPHESAASIRRRVAALDRDLTD